MTPSLISNCSHFPILPIPCFNASGAGTPSGLHCGISSARRLPEKTFGTSFESTSGLDGSIRYQVISSDEVDVIDAFSIDALLEKEGLVLLEDPPYYAVNLMRQDTLIVSQNWNPSWLN